MTIPVRSKWQSLPTEAINPATLAIDKLSPEDIVEEMLNEDRKMLAAVQREKDRIAVGIDIVSQSLRKGGRVVFVGAGTSGRLGLLESTEMPPTFGTDEHLVLAIMAGGKDAILHAKEGVEDNYEEGARSINRLSSGQEGRRHRRLGERHDAVRARRADQGAARRIKNYFRDVRSAHRAADVR